VAIGLATGAAYSADLHVELEPGVAGKCDLLLRRRGQQPGHPGQAGNMALLWKTAPSSTCEENQYAEFGPASLSSPWNGWNSRRQAFGMRAVTVDGNDLLAVYETTRQR